jgi:hypothetical protein
MKPVEKNNSFLKYMIIVMILAGLMMWPTALIAAQSDESQAPGRTMAQQATKGKKVWNTTDHTKHQALQKDFKSGLEVTQACLSCHSEAETQFHKTIHWTWLADPADKDKQFGTTRAVWPVIRDGVPQRIAGSTVWSVTVAKT